MAPLALLAGAAFARPAHASPGPIAASAPVTHGLAPYTRGRIQFRWLDVADNPYSEAFRKSFRYQPGQVSVTYRVEGRVLVGRLTARGLKPNFAYQIKLEGRPAGPAPAEPDPEDAVAWSNRQIGTLGRWWCVEEDCNTWDASAGDYHKGHTLLGYLLVDFFVTDARGNAVREFRSDSSFHVLWKKSQYAPAATDGRMRKSVVRGDAAYAYPARLPRSEVQIYPEREYGRAEPGKLRFPPGRYACRLLLTEESFHAYGMEEEGQYGGYWAHCLSDEELVFTVR
jgi:hypothetical protein